MRSSVILRWETISLKLDEAIKIAPQLIDKLKQSIQQKDKDIPVTRSEYDQLNGVLAKIAEIWPQFINATLDGFHKTNKVASWHDGSRRGYFRLLILMILLLLDRNHAKGGKALSPKGFAGMIEKTLDSISGKFIYVKKGSLYAAIESFESDGLITRRESATESNASIRVTDRGSAFILNALNAFNACLELLGKAGIFASIRQENLTSVKPINETVLKSTQPQIEISIVLQNITTLKKSNDALKAFFSPKDSNLADVKVLVEAWQDNINRGIIDIFVLGKFFAGPCYGNALISEAESSLKFQAGTLYPKIEDMISKGFIQKVINQEQLLALNKNAAKKQGPQKLYYDITATGAVYFISILGLFITDLNVFFNLARELTNSVIEPPQKPPAK
nr:hypothetical protein [Candidatus Sigynarchaeota archaeon]